MTNKLRCINRPSGWVDIKTTKMYIVHYGPTVLQQDFDYYVEKNYLKGLVTQIQLDPGIPGKALYHNEKVVNIVV